MIEFWNLFFSSFLMNDIKRVPYEQRMCLRSQIQGRSTKATERETIASSATEVPLQLRRMGQKDQDQDTWPLGEKGSRVHFPM